MRFYSEPERDSLTFSMSLSSTGLLQRLKIQPACAQRFLRNINVALQPWATTGD